MTTEAGNTIVLPAMGYASPPIKNAAGYYCAPGMDAIDLFIGSEGTLGIFAKIKIHLQAARPICAGLSFFESRDGAFAFADFLRNQQQVAAIEYFDGTALSFIAENKDAISLKLPEMPAGARAAVYWEYRENEAQEFEENMDTWEEILLENGSSFENTWSGFEAQEMERLKTFRHSVPELINLQIARNRQNAAGIRKVGTDAAVASSHFRTFFSYSIKQIENAGLSCVIFGHLGDCHLHFNIIPHDEKQMNAALEAYSAIMRKAVERGGTVSAEHGIGKLKTQYLTLMYGERAVEEMKKIKSVLDPGWLLNRGNVFAKE
jgi:D-lactate dehydrogenase (cytochrome)